MSARGRERIRRLPLKRQLTGFYTTLDGLYAFVRDGNGRWVVLDNDDADEAAHPIPLGPTEDTAFGTLHKAAWMFERYLLAASLDSQETPK